MQTIKQTGYRPFRSAACASGPHPSMERLPGRQVKRFFGAVLVYLCAASAEAGSYLDADNLDQAVGMVFVERATIDAVALHCATLLPDPEARFPDAAHAWRTSNAPELRAADLRLAADLEAFRKAVTPYVDTALRAYKTAIEQRGASTICDGFERQIRSGERDVARRTPRASTFLRSYLGGRR